MTEHCPEPVDIERILGLPREDPRRRHLEACPRCRNLARAYAEFLDPGPLDASVDLAEADAELARRLALTLPAAAPRPAARPRRLGRLLEWPTRPANALRLAAGAALALAGLLLLTDPARHRDIELPERRGELRGDETELLTAVFLPAGVELRWSPPAADREAIVLLFDAELAELARIPMGRADRLLLSNERLGAGIVYAQALFTAEGDTLARSVIIDLPATAR